MSHVRSLSHILIVMVHSLLLYVAARDAGHKIWSSMRACSNEKALSASGAVCKPFITLQLCNKFKLGKCRHICPSKQCLEDGSVDRRQPQPPGLVVAVEVAHGHRYYEQQSSAYCNILQYAKLADVITLAHLASDLSACSLQKPKTEGENG